MLTAEGLLFCSERIQNKLQHQHQSFPPFFFFFFCNHVRVSCNSLGQNITQKNREISSERRRLGHLVKRKNVKQEKKCSQLVPIQSQCLNWGCAQGQNGSHGLDPSSQVENIPYWTYEWNKELNWANVSYGAYSSHLYPMTRSPT